MKQVFFLLIVFVPFWSIAQRNTVVSGGTYTGTSGSVAFTVGQIDYQTINGSSGALTQGVQQPLEISTLSVTEVPQIQLTATVYPNPTVQNAILSIQEYDLSRLEFHLYDLQGKTIAKGKISESETPIELSGLASAQYFLKITDNQKEVKTFKIIKK